MIRTAQSCWLQCPLGLPAVRPMLRPFTAAIARHPAPSSAPAAIHRNSERMQCQASFFDIAWGVTGDVSAQDVAANLFAFSIVPYSGFLYCLTRSKKAPPLALFGFYFLLVFVFGTIPAGIYAKTKVGTTLANVDWLHGPAESLLTVTNLLIVLGFRRAIIDTEHAKGSSADEPSSSEADSGQVVASSSEDGQ